jgi:hypothetical protein
MSNFTSFRLFIWACTARPHEHGENNSRHVVPIPQCANRDLADAVAVMDLDPRDVAVEVVATHADFPD